MHLISRILRLFVVAIDRLINVLYRARGARFIAVSGLAYASPPWGRGGECGCECGARARTSWGRRGGALTGQVWVVVLRAVGGLAGVLAFVEIASFVASCCWRLCGRVSECGCCTSQYVVAFGCWACVGSAWGVDLSHRRTRRAGESGSRVVLGA
nr:MAG TPA: hypothetical protein [Caudoviricetes sp.]